MASPGVTALDQSEQTNQDAQESPHRKMYRYPTRRPAEVEEGPVDHEAYQQYRSTTDLREPYRIPRAYLQATKPFLGPEMAEAPLIVFINSKSGGHAGPKLTEVLFRALGHAQVFDLQQFRPGPVLRQIWQNFEQQKAVGDRHADPIQRRFRILAAGGDGTVAWILKTIQELKLDPAPQVAIMPLGTGNDLSLSFGWGNTFLQKWIDEFSTVYDTLKRVADAESRDLDAWQIRLSTAQPDMFSGLPHSLEGTAEEGATVLQVQGLFWNYFSLGMDAKAAYGFHSLREKHAWAASGRMVNQAWYAYFSCSSGWFCHAPPLRNKVTLKVRDGQGNWTEVKLNRGIKALVLLNLQSYGGGRDLWGLSDVAKDEVKGWQTPIFNDGLIEVVGLKNGWHTGAVMGGVSSKVHAKRLAQASAIRMELKAHGGAVKGEKGVSHMQLDGEPWAQDIPAGEHEPLVVELELAGRSRMLFNSVKMKGIDARITRLAEREGRVSRTTTANNTPEKAVPPLHLPSAPGARPQASPAARPGGAGGAANGYSPQSAIAGERDLPTPRDLSSPSPGGQEQQLEVPREGPGQAGPEEQGGVSSLPSYGVTTDNPAADEEREIATQVVPVPVPTNAGTGLSDDPGPRS